MHHDGSFYHRPQLALKAAALTGDTSGEIIDTAGAHSIEFACFTGAVTTADASNYLAFELWESDDSGMAGAVQCAGTDLIVDNRDGLGPTVGATAQRVNLTTRLDTLISTIRWIARAPSVSMHRATTCVVSRVSFASLA